MPSDEHMNALIRSARSDPVDLTDAVAVNKAIRAAAGVTTPGPPPPLPPPPLPGDSEDAFRVWANDASSAGVSDRELAAYTSRWLAQHRAILADREDDR
jgi:hypothetical protein